MTVRDWDPDDIAEMHRRYMDQGLTLRELGDELGISHERVRQLFQEHDLPTQKPKRQTVNSYTQRAEAWQRKEEVRDLYKELGTVEAVAEALDLPKHFIAPVLEGMELRQLYRRRGKGNATYSDDFIKECLRAAASLCPTCKATGIDDDGNPCAACEATGQRDNQPLTIPAYRRLAPSHNFPADLTVIRTFESWYAACIAAGVKANPSKGPQNGKITPENCIAALRLCAADIGRVPSYELYSKWAKEHGSPSGPTVRVKVGPWSTALHAAFDNELTSAA